MSNSRFLIMLITLVCLIGCGDPGDDPGGMWYH